jgi:pimeloyl-ACP methyl ester carboxylesterase
MEHVILVHGLWMSGHEMWTLGRYLETEFGYRCHRLPYHSVTASLAENVSRLRGCLQRLQGETAHLVAHSLGGVVVMEMLGGYEPPWIGRVVLLGSPLQGSSAARQVARWPGGRHLLGETVMDALLDERRLSWRGRAEIGVIAGDVPLGMGRLAGLLEGPNDGTVAVQETQLPGARDQLVMHVTHFAMLFSRAVAVQVAGFLRSGRFHRASPGYSPPSSRLSS